jgi:hypothetical protein
MSKAVAAEIIRHGGDYHDIYNAKAHLLGFSGGILQILRKKTVANLTPEAQNLRKMYVRDQAIEKAEQQEALTTT